MTQSIIRSVRSYDDEFKQRAVKLYHSSNKSFKTVAQDLGIPVSTLVGWVYSTKLGSDIGGSEQLNTVELIHENKKLRRELAEVEDERDILKKALAIFSPSKRSR